MVGGKDRGGKYREGKLTLFDLQKSHMEHNTINISKMYAHKIFQVELPITKGTMLLPDIIDDQIGPVPEKSHFFLSSFISGVP